MKTMKYDNGRLQLTTKNLRPGYCGYNPQYGTFLKLQNSGCVLLDTHTYISVNTEIPLIPAKIEILINK